MTKSEIQAAAKEAWVKAGQRGLAAMGTGTGKSKLAIDIISDFYAEAKVKSKLKVLIAVPTEKLRDENWPAEFVKWKMKKLLKYCTIVCYASLDNYRAEDFNLVVLDEAHRITEKSAIFFENTSTKPVPVIALTATPPGQGNENDQLKAAILAELKIPTIFQYTLDEGVQDGNIANYNIWVIPVALNNVKKIVSGGTKAKPFLTTEDAGYRYISKQIMQAQITNNEGWAQALYQKRMHYIYGLKSKTVVAERLLTKFKVGTRIIVFCGSIDQSIELVGNNRVYNSKSDDVALKDFKAQKLDILGVVNAMNEGHNIENLDVAVIVQVNSNERDLVQRIGRVVRFRKGHTARIFILVAQGTQDEKWAEKALKSFDPAKIHYLSEKAI